MVSARAHTGLREVPLGASGSIPLPNSRSSPPVRSVIKFDGMCAYSAMYALFHSPLYAQDSGLSREHPITPVAPRIPGGIHDEQRPEAPTRAAEDQADNLRLQAYLSGRPAEEISSRLLPVISDDEDRLIAYTAANLQSGDKRKSELTNLVLEWKPRGFAATPTALSMSNPVCEQPSTKPLR
jgi:hypothetical protein